MNQNQLNKVRLLISGVQSKLKEESEYFIDLIFELVSGNKKYSATVLYDQDELSLNFPGINRKILIEDFTDEIIEMVKMYDSFTLSYRARGSKVVLECNEKNCKIKNEEIKGEILKKQFENNTSASSRKHYVSVDGAKEVLNAIGIISENGKIKNDMVRKYNQIDHFVELIDPYLKRLSSENGVFNVLDCACGKSYLSFVLNYYINEQLKKNSYFVGLDYSKSVIESSKEIAKKLGYKNMNFKCMKISEYIPERRIDMVISLHGCDTATDEALAFAVKNDARFIVAVPCCQKELIDQIKYNELSPILKHGILKSKFASIVTDGVRAQLLEAMGYKVSVVEYISPLDTPKNLMIMAEKNKNLSTKTLDEYLKFKSLVGINPSLERLLNDYGLLNNDYYEE